MEFWYKSAIPEATQNFTRSVIQLCDALPLMETSPLKTSIERHMPGFLSAQAVYPGFVESIELVGNELFPEFHTSILKWGDTNLKLNATDYHR